jgi:hypothetical protein
MEKGLGDLVKISWAAGALEITEVCACAQSASVTMTGDLENQ